MVFLIHNHTTHKIWLALNLSLLMCATPSYSKESGTWKDLKTGLTWQRCSLGQAWSGYDCDGEPKNYTWDEAQQAANAIGKDWRVPAASELMSLVRCNTGFQKTTSVPDSKGGNKTIPSLCNDGVNRPTIDNTVFPNTPANVYWSSSPVADYSSAAWFVNFYHGGDYIGNKILTGYVRLVRSGQ